MGKHFDSFYRGYFVGEMESALLQVKRDRKRDREAEEGRVSLFQKELLRCKELHLFEILDIV